MWSYRIMFSHQCINEHKRDVRMFFLVSFVSILHLKFRVEWRQCLKQRAKKNKEAAWVRCGHHTAQHWPKVSDQTKMQNAAASKRETGFPVISLLAGQSSNSHHMAPLCRTAALQLLLRQLLQGTHRHTHRHTHHSSPQKHTLQFGESQFKAAFEVFQHRNLLMFPPQSRRTTGKRSDSKKVKRGKRKGEKSVNEPETERRNKRRND